MDDYSRLAYVEVLDTCNAADSAVLMGRAITWFAAKGATLEAVMTDNAMAYANSHAFREVRTSHSVRHVRIPPRRPQLNGKVERSNRTLVGEWAAPSCSRQFNGVAMP